ncbi:hypothetical protein C8J56DRAFT_1052986 [Mycena floridula]|nr:hypothetical protein C8J56DRAFT_1052986 [Mycena floridula]
MAEVVSSTSSVNTLRVDDQLTGLIQYSGGWDTAGGLEEYLATTHKTFQSGVSAIFSFTGSTGAKVVGTLGPTFTDSSQYGPNIGTPNSSYSIDRTSLKLYSGAFATAPKYSQTFFQATGLENGQHTLRLTYLGGSPYYLDYIEYIQPIADATTVAKGSDEAGSGSGAAVQSSATHATTTLNGADPASETSVSASLTFFPSSTSTASSYFSSSNTTLSSNSISSEPSSSISNTVPTSSPSSHNSTSAVVGGVSGARNVFDPGLILLWFFCHRRRKNWDVVSAIPDAGILRVTPFNSQPVSVGGEAGSSSTRPREKGGFPKRLSYSQFDAYTAYTCTVAVISPISPQQ